MLARYLGNKTAVLGPLMNSIRGYAEPGDHVVDAFSGSLSVSMALKAQGFRVTANDANLFSAVFGDAYLIPQAPPEPVLADLLRSRRIPGLRKAATSEVETMLGSPGYDFLDTEEWRRRYVDYVTLLRHLMTMKEADLPARHRRHDFFDTYCEDGANAAFRSSRGTEGRRRFFIPANAERLDLIMNQIRAWTMAGLVDGQTRALLLAGIVRGVEQVSNTQGTFHDFIREGWDSRALGPLRLTPPALDPTIGGMGGNQVGRERDTLDFISEVDQHKVLYLDPPYNFRQYSAYYFLPNVICRYPDMDDPASYFADVQFVRGQNPADDFTSSFCKASRFISDMETLIERARCETVVISYYNGANHWGKFDSGPDNTGRERLTEMLSGSLFEPNSLRVTEVPRRNYASYGGFTARHVTELVLVARKVQTVPHASEGGAQRGVRAVAG